VSDKGTLGTWTGQLRCFQLTLELAEQVAARKSLDYRLLAARTTFQHAEAEADSNLG
jgi:hypothetical protein